MAYMKACFCPISAIGKDASPHPLKVPFGGATMVSCGIMIHEHV